MDTIKWIWFWMMLAFESKMVPRRNQELRQRLNALLRALGKQIAADDYVGDRADACSALVLSVLNAREHDHESMTDEGLAELCRQCENQLTTFRNAGRAS